MYSANYKFFNNKYKRLKYFFNNHPLWIVSLHERNINFKKSLHKCFKFKNKNADLLDLAVNIYLYGRLKY